MARDQQKDEIRDVCRNRRASHEYEILDRLECGLVLTGTEVKSLRDGHAMLEDAYAKIDEGELWLLGGRSPSTPWAT
jgi:SsrA-binding protein